MVRFLIRKLYHEFRTLIMAGAALAVILFGAHFFSPCASAAVFKIGRARSSNQLDLLFYDQHRGTRSFIDMKELDKKQREPLWQFFDTLTDDRRTSLVLLELSQGERKKLLALTPARYKEKAFRKQLGYHFVTGKQKWGNVTIDSWDDRDESHRQVSWLLANTIDVLMLAYQKEVGCTAEKTCLTWFDENAANDFFKHDARDERATFHERARIAVTKALLGKTLTPEEKEMGFWSVKPILVSDYLNSLKRYTKILARMTQSEEVPHALMKELQETYAGSKAKIEQLVSEYRVAQPQKKPTMNQVVLYHLMQSKTLTEFDQKVYAPLSTMSIALGDITLIAKLIDRASEYDIVVVYAGGNHMPKVLEYLQTNQFKVQDVDVLELSDDDPEQFAECLRGLLK